MDSVLVTWWVFTRWKYPKCITDKACYREMMKESVNPIFLLMIFELIDLIKFFNRSGMEIFSLFWFCVLFCEKNSTYPAFQAFVQVDKSRLRINPKRIIEIGTEWIVRFECEINICHIDIPRHSHCLHNFTDTRRVRNLPISINMNCGRLHAIGGVQMCGWEQQDDKCMHIKLFHRVTRWCVDQTRLRKLWNFLLVERKNFLFLLLNVQLDNLFFAWFVYILMTVRFFIAFLTVFKFFCFTFYIFFLTESHF